MKIIFLKYYFKNYEIFFKMQLIENCAQNSPLTLNINANFGKYKITQDSLAFAIGEFLFDFQT